MTVPPARGVGSPALAWVDGLENPAESLHNIAAWLVQEGFIDDETSKVLGVNVARALGEIWI